MTKTLFLSLLLLVSAPCALCADTPVVSDFNQLVDQYFDFYFSFHPTEGTLAGLHQYDSKLEDYSAPAQQKQIRGLKEFLSRFESIGASKLSADAADRDWVVSLIHSQLLELESIQMWRKDPNRYSGTANYAIFLILKRHYAPLDERLRSVIARERQIPKLLETA